MALYLAALIFVVAPILAILFTYIHWKITLLKNVPSFVISFPFGFIGYNNIFNFILPIRTFVVYAVEGLAILFAEEGMVYIKIFHKNMLLLCSPETAEVLLSDRNELKKSSVYNTGKLLFGNGLVTSDGDAEWKFHRKLIGSNFNMRMLNKYQIVMAEKATILCEILSSSDKDKPIEISTLIDLANFDISIETINGTNLNVQKNPNSKLIKSAHLFQKIWVERIFDFWQQLEAMIFFNISKSGKQLQRTVFDLRTYYRETLAEKRLVVLDRINRMKSGELYDDCTERPCLIEHLINHQISNEDSLTDQEILDEAVTVITAGYETTAVAVSGALFLIGHHPDIQTKIQEELDQIFGSETDRLVTSDDISKMTYLNLVVLESLRLYPTIPLIARKLQSDFEIKGKRIPKGTEVAVVISAIHKNPKYFSNPEQFIPERFLPENRRNMPRYSYIPFSSGPRDCIGSSYAIKSMMTILSSILRKFWVESIEQRDKVIYSMGISLHTTKPLHIKITKRMQKSGLEMK